MCLIEAAIPLVLGSIQIHSIIIIIASYHFSYIPENVRLDSLFLPALLKAYILNIRVEQDSGRDWRNEVRLVVLEFILSPLSFSISTW